MTWDSAGLIEADIIRIFLLPFKTNRISICLYICGNYFWGKGWKMTLLQNTYISVPWSYSLSLDYKLIHTFCLYILSSLVPNFPGKLSTKWNKFRKIHLTFRFVYYYIATESFNRWKCLISYKKGIILYVRRVKPFHAKLDISLVWAFKTPFWL